MTRTWVKTFVLLLKQWCWYSHSVYVNVKTRYTDIPSKYQNNKYILSVYEVIGRHFPHKHQSTFPILDSSVVSLFPLLLELKSLDEIRGSKSYGLSACVNMEDFRFHFHHFEKKSAGRHCDELENARSLAIP